MLRQADILTCTTQKIINGKFNNEHVQWWTVRAHHTWAMLIVYISHGSRTCRFAKMQLSPFHGSTTFTAIVWGDGSNFFLSPLAVTSMQFQKLITSWAVYVTRFTLAPSGRPVRSVTNLASLATQQLHARTKSLILPPPSIARYSFIQPSELERCGANENAQSSKR